MRKTKLSVSFAFRSVKDDILSGVSNNPSGLIIEGDRTIAVYKQSISKGKYTLYLMNNDNINIYIGDDTEVWNEIKREKKYLNNDELNRIEKFFSQSEYHEVEDSKGVTVDSVKQKQVFTAKEAVSEYFNNAISYSKLLADFRQGKIPGVRISSKRILFRRDALDKWMEENEHYKVVHPIDTQEVKMW